MDAEPPQIVFATPAQCSDARRAEGLLEQALSRTPAPGAGWVVTMRVARMGAGVLHADGEITDERGAPVGRRVLQRKATDCSGLARAIGVWASLVLDAEGRRPKGNARAQDDAAPMPEDTARRMVAAATDGGAQLGAMPAEADARDLASLPTSSDDRLVRDHDPDRESPSRRDEGETLELGAGTFLMTGTGGGLATGVTPFMLVEAGKGFFIRPALLFGESLPSSGPDVTLATTRGDACLRVTGLYTSRNGMQLDLCAGADLGVVRTSRTVPYLAFGPSLDLRGELGGD
ncbi:MAG: hypothetical protein JOZ69_13460, partial [Myxococcales bacterium]|nr:hypothetical protein [Myxococcales bacterium]